MSWVRDNRTKWRQERKRLRRSMLLAIAALTTLVIVGTVMMHQLESWSWISSFYFSVTTLATVGYGDLHPTHEASRLFTAFYVIAGVTIALSAMTIIGRNYLMFIERQLYSDQREAQRRRMERGISGRVLEPDEGV